MNAIAQAANQIIDIDIERDRKTCVALDLKVSGANRELAQWIYNHHNSYTDANIAEWLGCGKTRINDLRMWAQSGFLDEKHPTKQRAGRKDFRRAGNPPLKSLDNFDSADQENAISGGESTEVADPATIEDNALYTIQRINEHARVFKKLFKASSFDRETRDRISTAIERMIQKWRSTQATLERKGSDDDKA